MRVVTEREERMRRLATEIVDPVRRYLHRRTDAATADDVLGDTLLVCWRRLDEVPDDALPWAIVVARNCLANAERSARRQQRVVGKIIALDPPAEAVDDLRMHGAGIHSASDADASEVRTALTRLRPADAELLRLWAWEQLTITQLAAALDISTNAVTIRLHRAKARLREELVKAPRASGHVVHEEGSTDDRQ